MDCSTNGRLATRSAISLAPRLEETLAGYLIMLLVLVPYFAFQVLDDALGKGRLVRMFFIEREPMTPK